VITIVFPQPTVPLSMNDRRHWSKKAPDIRAWRHTAKFHALQQWKWRRGALPVMDTPPSLVVCTFQFARGARRDPENYHQTTKPIVDGLVDAGVWPDDTAEWVTVLPPVLELVTVPRRGYPLSVGVCTVRIAPRDTDGAHALLLGGAS